ncbi:MAG: glycosyltransferase [Candidatus Oleimicrobiaceae bacterium]
MWLPDFHTFATLVLGLLILNLAANVFMLKRTAPSGEPGPLPSLSVLIPARNEARNINRCLRSLLAQDYPALEVVVLDDGSTDATPLIVREWAKRDKRVRLVQGKDLPPGWMGKNFACHQLAEEARGEWLLFTDADTDHRQNSLKWSVHAAQQNRADLLSLIPHTVMHSFGERLILPIITFGLLVCLPLAVGERLRRPSLAMAIGPFMLFRRDAYRRIGGHRSVRGEVVEDVALARRVRQSGGRVTLLDGTNHVKVHFYQGFREAWQGLAKSAFPALGGHTALAALGAGVLALLFIRPPALLLQWLWQGAVPSHLLVPALVQAFTNSGLWYLVAQRFRLPRSVALLYPLTVLLTVLLLADSMWRSRVSGIPWKGRVYQLRGGTASR